MTRVVYLIKRILPIYVGLVSVILITYTFYKQHKKEIIFGPSQYTDIEKINKSISILETKINKMENIIEIPSNNRDNNLIEEKLIKIERKVNNIEQQTIGLRQAINPLRPEEIVTIARLHDEIIILKKKMDEINDNLKREQDNFKTNVTRELDASGRLTYIIVAILVPLALTFSYTVWKDRKSDKLG